MGVFFMPPPTLFFRKYNIYKCLKAAAGKDFNEILMWFFL
jgi:hypothetical protein